MTISAFDLFKVGIGPSSSHTVGPMRAACTFASRLRDEGLVGRVAGVRCELFGSLGATGHGHGSVKAVVLGLEGEQPDLVDPVAAEPRVTAVRAEGKLLLAGEHPIPFSVDDDVVLHRRKRLPFHTNGMLFRAFDADGTELRRREYYSVGGGFVLDEDETGAPAIVEDRTPVRYPFRTGEELLARTRETGLRISDVMLANELSWRSEAEVRAGLLHIWAVMQECVQRGTSEDGVVRFLLTAAAIGLLFKENASISGAEVGCQGEVGSACSMAAAGLAEVIGGTPEQVENAAEIGIEHNLGLTCDPVGGLVQIPCIERNAVGSVKAITAARMAVRGDGRHHVPLDKAIKTMRETGADMKDKYKETARGGLALNIVEC
jgi:L-serine deaminase